VVEKDIWGYAISIKSKGDIAHNLKYSPLEDMKSGLIVDLKKNLRYNV